MRKISLILSDMSGRKYYAKRGLKKTITVYVTEATYNALLQQAEAKEWSLQTFIRQTLEASAKDYQKFKPPQSH